MAVLIGLHSDQKTSPMLGSIRHFFWVENFPRWSCWGNGHLVGDLVHHHVNYLVHLHVSHPNVTSTLLCSQVELLRKWAPCGQLLSLLSGSVWPRKPQQRIPAPATPMIKNTAQLEKKRLPRRQKGQKVIHCCETYLCGWKCSKEMKIREINENR